MTKENVDFLFGLNLNHEICQRIKYSSFVTPL